MKKQMITTVLAISLGCFLIVGCDGPAEEAGEEIDETVSRQQEQLEQAHRKVVEAKEEISRLQTQLQDARRQRDEARTELEMVKQERQRILEEIEKTGKAIEEQKDGPADGKDS